MPRAFNNKKPTHRLRILFTYVRMVKSFHYTNFAIKLKIEVQTVSIHLRQSTNLST